MNLRLKIEEKCKDCTYDPLGEGTWKQQVEACSVRACPLWVVRPVSFATKQANKPARTPAQEASAVKAAARFAEYRRKASFSPVTTENLSA